jgi:hypothetical protein
MIHRTILQWKTVGHCTLGNRHNLRIITEVRYHGLRRRCKWRWRITGEDVEGNPEGMCRVIWGVLIVQLKVRPGVTHPPGCQLHAYSGQLGRNHVVTTGYIRSHLMGLDLI